MNESIETKPNAAARFSVLIAAYNAETTLGETLDSVLTQTRSDWEVIVVDDGSSDSTGTVAASYAQRDGRIRLLAKPNGGTASARNLAARNASTELLCLLDADDSYMPEYLERMGRFIDLHPEFDIYSSDGYILHPSGERRPNDLISDIAPLRSYAAEDLLVCNRIWVQSIVRRSTFDSINGFDEDAQMLNEDYDFWLRALLCGAQHIHNAERLWIYRISPESKSADAVAVARGNAYVLDRLIDGGSLRGARLQVARRSRSRLERFPEDLAARRARESLETRLLRGDVSDARRLYARARGAYPSRLKYAVGLGIVSVSPSLFARVLRRRGTSTTWAHGPTEF
jgi:glycosyltransferase involved in cell wall biosynthesis